MLNNVVEITMESCLDWHPSVCRIMMLFRYFRSRLLPCPETASTTGMRRFAHTSLSSEAHTSPRTILPMPTF